MFGNEAYKSKVRHDQNYFRTKERAYRLTKTTIDHAVTGLVLVWLEFLIWNNTHHACMPIIIKNNCPHKTN